MFPPDTPPDTPRGKTKEKHFGDPKIYQIESMDIPKQKVAKFFYGRFFNKIQKLYSVVIAKCLKIEPSNIAH